jgi:hypothetical protein
MVTKAQLISDLKSRGQRGRLSKMTKSELQKLLHSEGQSGSGRGKIELEPLSGGTSESQARPKSNYQAFVSKHLAAHNGSMKKVAELYRQQHAKNHTPEHMQAMDGAMAEGQDFDEAHQKAMSQVGAGDDVDKYMSGGSYWNSNTYKDVVDGPDGDPDIDHFLEGGAHWDENEYTGGNWEDDLNPKNWSKDTWGNVLSAAGVLGLTMAGAPEAEELPAMSNASTQAVETSEFGTQVGTEDNLPPRFQGEEPPIAPVTRVGADLSAADRARLEPPPAYEDPPEYTPRQSEIPTQTEAEPTETEPTEEEPMPDAAEEPPGRAQRVRDGIKRQYEQRMGLKQGTMDMKPGETKTAYFRRVGYQSLPSAGKLAAVSATETGENLKSEFERDQIEKKVGDEAKDTRDKIDALNLEREEEQDNSLAARWQAARDRTSNPYLQ